MGGSLKALATRAVFSLFFLSSVTVAATSAPLTISTSNLPQATAMASYTGTLTATGGTAPYTWSISTGRLPAGLSLAAKTGTISGTPTTSGNYSFGVKVTDSTLGAGWSKVEQDRDRHGDHEGRCSCRQANILGHHHIKLALWYARHGVLERNRGHRRHPSLFMVNHLRFSSRRFQSRCIHRLISGTPTASGTFSFTASVSDTSSPVQYQIRQPAR